MDAYQSGFILFDLTHDQCQMKFIINDVLVSYHFELAELSGYLAAVETLDSLFVANPVVDQIGNGAHLQVMLFCHCLKIGTTCHGAIFIEDLYNH